MNSILISPKSENEFNLLISLLSKMKIAKKVVSEEEKEDLGLAMLMKKADRTKKVSKEEILKKFKK